MISVYVVNSRPLLRIFLSIGTNDIVFQFVHNVSITITGITSSNCTEKGLPSPVNSSISFSSKYNFMYYLVFSKEDRSFPDPKVVNI